MYFSRLAGAGRKFLGLLPAFACLTFQAGCDSGADLTKPVYSSAEQVDKQKQGIADAMKGGAYGRAGQKAANQPGFVK
jgi:hypothetical protein